MPIDWRRYPTNWSQISHQIKEAANWRCQYCGRQCYRPGEKPDNLTRSEWTIHTLSVHHRNHKPEDNRRENLIAVCTSCHLTAHRGGRGNASPGQLSLW